MKVLLDLYTGAATVGVVNLDKRSLEFDASTKIAVGQEELLAKLR